MHSASLLVSFITGKKVMIKRTQTMRHPYFPLLAKSPDKNRAKRLRQLEKYELVQNMKAKRLRGLSISDKENVSSVEVYEQFIDRGTQIDTLDVTNKGCQTEYSIFQDVECQTKDVKVESLANQTEAPTEKVDKGVQEARLPFDLDDMKHDKK